MEARTLLDLRTMTRERLFDFGKSKPLFSDDLLNRALNEAQAEAAVRARLLRDEVTDSVTLVTALANAPVVLLHRSIFDVDRVERADDGTVLHPTSKPALDRRDRLWRSRSAERPCEFVVQVRPDERLQLLLVPVPTIDTTLRLTVYRTPRFAMEAEDDVPEIAPVHHDGLVAWACHRALSNRDPDQYEPDKAAKFEKEFTAQFGVRLSAEDRRLQREPRERTAIARDF